MLLSVVCARPLDSTLYQAHFAVGYADGSVQLIELAQTTSELSRPGTSNTFLYSTGLVGRLFGRWTSQPQDDGLSEFRFIFDL